MSRATPRIIFPLFALACLGLTLVWVPVVNAQHGPTPMAAGGSLDVHAGYRAFVEALERSRTDGVQRFLKIYDAHLEMKPDDVAVGLDDAISCSVLGERYRDGIGVPVDLAKADTIWSRACQLGDQRACALRQPAAAATN